LDLATKEVQVCITQCHEQILWAPQRHEHGTVSNGLAVPGIGGAVLHLEGMWGASWQSSFLPIIPSLHHQKPGVTQPLCR